MLRPQENLAYRPIARRSRRGIFVPSDMQLTATVLVEAMRKMRTSDIADAIELLIDEMDIRLIDCDLENELDEI